jgi:hypothetical protein
LKVENKIEFKWRMRSGNKLNWEWESEGEVEGSRTRNS